MAQAEFNKYDEYKRELNESVSLFVSKEGTTTHHSIILVVDGDVWVLKTENVLQKQQIF